MVIAMRLCPDELVFVTYINRYRLFSLFIRTHNRDYIVSDHNCDYIVIDHNTKKKYRSSDTGTV